VSANLEIWRQVFPRAQFIQLFRRVLRQPILDLIPSRKQFDKNMLVGFDARIVVEESSGNFEPIARRSGNGDRAAAGRTEGRMIGGWAVKNRCGIGSDEFTSGKEAVVFGVHANHKECGATRNLSAAITVAKPHGANRLVNLKRDAATKT